MARGHFEREAYIQWLIPGSILLVGLIATLVALTCVDFEAARIDRCLDSSGSYDQMPGRCDFEATHPSP